MSRKKSFVKGGALVPGIRESSRLTRAHESMVDLINQHHASSILDVFASTFFGFNFSRRFAGDLEEDIFSDDDDDDDDYDEYYYCPHNVHRPLEPHPQIKQLTDEEANKHAMELIAEEKRHKERTEKNKRKKLRKKEKKRLKKENEAKDILPEEDQGKPDSSENKEENPTIKNNAESNKCPESGKTQNAPEAAGCDESSGDNKEENPVKIIKKEDGAQKDLNLNNSNASTAKSGPEETSNQKPAKERKKEKTKLLEVQQSKEEKQKVLEKPEPNNEETADTTVDEFAKRSRELAGVAYRLAASGQYEMAVKYFTEAIKYNPKEFKLFGNRSLCYERMQQFENALRDADLALCMEPNWIKGLFRKGKALCGLQRYYEASLIYKEVLKLESSSAEALQELKRAQTLHLMEMGFTCTQSSEALKTHGTLEEAVEALFGGGRRPAPPESSASRANKDQPAVEDEDGSEGEWTVLQASRPRMQQVKECNALDQIRSKSQSPTPHSRRPVKQKLFSVWVGCLAPAVTYATLHELFSRAGMVYSIKMLLEHQCAFVNYTRSEDCDRAIQCIDGMVVEGAPLSVRYPNRVTGLGTSRSAAASDPFSPPGPYKKECFFWRTTGCTRQDCTYKHVPEHKNIDRDKFTSRLGNFNM